MRSHNHLLAQLRELFYNVPSVYTWNSIRRLLSVWQRDAPDSLALGLAYAAEHLDTWSDAWRRIEVRSVRPFVRAAPEAAWPLVRHLFLYECPAQEEVLRQFAQLPHLEPLRALTIYFRADEQIEHNNTLALSALFRSPHLRGLRYLGIHGGVMHSEALAMFLDTMSTPHLESLHLYSNHIGAQGAGLLARSSLLAQLISLDLGKNNIRNEGVETLSLARHARAAPFVLRV